MSLELAIQQNTEAIIALTQHLQASYDQGNKAVALTEKLLNRVHGDTAIAAETCCAEKPKKAKPAKVEEPISTTDALPTPEPVKAAAPVTAVAVTLADLQAEGKKLLDAGRQAELKQVVTDLKGTKLSLLPASDYPAALKALKALTAGL